MKPLLLTMGDPTGIGPELIIKTLLDGNLDKLHHPVEIVGDVNILQHAGKIFHLKLKSLQLAPDLYSLETDGFCLNVHVRSQLKAASLNYGQPDNACGKAMVDYIEYAVSRCKNQDAAGLVTGPINKASINAAGYSFPGHTELLAQRCDQARVVMMLAGEKLRVCLVTTHVPLRDVASRLNSDDILRTIEISDRSLRRHFGITAPRLAVLALNPHAGEQGLFGDEEERLITPAIRAARRQNISVDGPHSADTLFYFAVRGDYDAVICMYHDQGLIPLKLLHFDDAVNVTLGLPIIRTSVDHGTAYDLAGSGRANCASLVAALKLADQMARNLEQTIDPKPLEKAHD